MKNLTSRYIKPIVLGASLSLFSYAGYAANPETDPIVKDIQLRWAALNYSDTNEKEAIKQLDTLVEETEMHVLQYPDNADILIWNAIALSTLAKKQGGLGALSMVKYAKVRLEKALTLEPDALNGSAYASLGTLYHKVPSWPVGFGSNRKARKHFEKALEINPDGLDINYFYADFLADMKEKELAIEHLNKALSSPDLDGRPIADAGRRAQAQSLLSKLKS